MMLVFFIYGLAFFILGTAIFIYPKKDSDFRLAKDIVLVGVFGLLHGINEWVDMFILIQKPEEAFLLKIARAFLVPLSFFFLMWFGARAIASSRKKFEWVKGLVFILALVWVFIFVFAKDKFLYGDIWARYLLGFSGALLTALGFVLQASNFGNMKCTFIKRDLKICAISFIFYAILAGAIVPNAEFFPASILNYSWFKDILGFPVQILRAVCAVIITVFTGKILVIFSKETKDRLDGLIFDLKNNNRALEVSKSELNGKNEELKIGNKKFQSAIEELSFVNERLRRSQKELEDSAEKLRQDNDEAQKAKENMENKMLELERFNKLSVGRELKMSELKKRIKELEEKLKQDG